VLSPGRQHGEVVIIGRSWAWFAARVRDDWHGDHGTNDSRRSDTPLGILRACWATVPWLT